MNENEIKTINISIDEYFDLRTKANMNDLVMRELGRMDNRLFEFDNKVIQLEDRMKKLVLDMKGCAK